MQSFLIYFISLCFYLLVGIRLVLTNHWTTGKKLLVGLVGSLIWYQIIMSYLFFTSKIVMSSSIIACGMLPTLLTGIGIAFAIYRKNLED